MTMEQFIESISTIPYRSLEKEFDFARQNQALVTPHLWFCRRKFQTLVEFRHFLEFDDAQFQMETFQTGYYIDACQMVSGLFSELS